MATEPKRLISQEQSIGSVLPTNQVIASEMVGGRFNWTIWSNYVALRAGCAVQVYRYYIGRKPPAMCDGSPCRSSGRAPPVFVSSSLGGPDWISFHGNETNGDCDAFSLFDDHK